MGINRKWGRSLCEDGFVCAKCVQHGWQFVCCGFVGVVVAASADVDGVMASNTLSFRCDEVGIPYAKDVLAVVALDAGYLPPLVWGRWDDRFSVSVRDVPTSLSRAHDCVSFSFCFGCRSVSHLLGCLHTRSWWMPEILSDWCVYPLSVVEGGVVVVVGSWLSLPWYCLFGLDCDSGCGVLPLFDPGQVIRMGDSP